MTHEEWSELQEQKRQEAENILQSCGIKPEVSFKCKKLGVDYYGRPYTTIYRAYREDVNNIFVYAPKKKRYGWRLTIREFVSTYKPLPVPSEEVKLAREERGWKKRIQNVINALEESGLWPHIKVKYQNLITVSLAEKHRIHDEYWNYTYKDPAYDDFVARVKQQYPFMVYQNQEGKDLLDTFYIWEMSECRTKSMYFGKYSNTEVKNEIAQAIKAQRHHTYYCRTNYDIRFEYVPERQAAYYSEEYKDCGNGHYYLAVNHTMALFCEND
jgi:hypothetical protein